MRINTNIMAFNAYRNLNVTNDMLGEEPGEAVVGLPDQPGRRRRVGLWSSARTCDKQVSGLRQATQNAQDGISVVQTAEGALTQVNSMLKRIHDLIVQSANTASSDSTARTAAQNEIVQLRDEIDRIGNTTVVRIQNLLDGSFGAQAAQLTSIGTGLTSGVTLAGVTPSTAASVTFDAGNTDGAAVSVEVSLTPARTRPRRRSRPSCRTPSTSPTDRRSPASPARSPSRSPTSAPACGQTELQAQQHRRSGTNGRDQRAIGDDIGVVDHCESVSRLSAATPAAACSRSAPTSRPTNQIHVSIDDIRITGGTNGTYTALCEHRRHRHDQPYGSRQRSSTQRSLSVSALRGQLGADQNRFQSTIATCRSRRRTSPLPRAASVTPTWPSEMVTSPATRSCSRPVRPCSPRRTRHRRPCSACCSSSSYLIPTPGREGPGPHPTGDPSF